MLIDSQPAKTSASNQLIDICIVEDDRVFAQILQKTLEKNLNYNVDIFQNAGDFLIQLYKKPDIVIIDYNLPDMNGLKLIERIKAEDEQIKTVIVSGQSDIQVVVEAYKKGAFDYIMKTDNCLPEIENSVKNLAANVMMRKELESLKSQVVDRNKYRQIIGNSEPIKKVLRLIEKAEKSDILVLVTGESGSGKELVARGIHYNSRRKNNPFVPVNMAAIPKDLIESELFGHEKGAFTGAISRRVGKFEEANKGTIFLDEIGEMDLSLQSKILRILEDKKVTRLGSNKTIDLDMRIIAATNKDLAEEVKLKQFREDLYYRLQGFLIHMPPLRERYNDIIQLSKYFLENFARANKMGPLTISMEAFEILQQYSWPGNVRELRSVIERAALLCNEQTILPEDLMLNKVDNQKSLFDKELTMEEYKMEIIKDFLQRYDNNIDLVAKKLDIGRATIYRMIKKIPN